MKGLVLKSFILLLIFFVSFSCKSQEEKNKELMAGVWEFKEPNILKTITLSKEGTFDTAIIITEENSEMIINKGNLSGRWDLTGDKFTLNIGNVSETIQKEIDWKSGETVLFNFEAVSLKRLMLKKKQDKIQWRRTIDPLTNEPMNSKDIFIDMKPIAVNLYKERIRGKERFLCLHYKLQFEDTEGLDYIITTKEEEPPRTYYELHPRLRDAVIMFLSSQTFKDVKTFAKSNRMNKKLETILNHYLGNKLKTLEIVRIVVASSQDGVKEFIGFDGETEF